MAFGKKKTPAIRSLVGEGTTLQGEVQFKDGLRIDGEVNGDVTAVGPAPSLLVISENARVCGKVTAGHVIINGTVQGPLYATEMLELQPKARVSGDVHYLALEMHSGAIINGEMHALNGEDKPTLKLAASNE